LKTKKRAGKGEMKSEEKTGPRPPHQYRQATRISSLEGKKKNGTGMNLAFMVAGEENS